MNSTFSDWEAFFKGENRQEYSIALHRFLNDEYQQHIVYPPRPLMFNAFKKTPLGQVKVVIIGQDPYHEPGQAMGLSFSVPAGIPLPMSLINIYKELESDLGVAMDYQSGDLTFWAEQGVLLLNAYLSVRKGEPLSHRHPGYETFFEHVIQTLNAAPRPIVFLLWGSFARGYKKYLTNPDHLILEAVHPSPLAANRGGWFGQRHFSKTNAFLERHDTMPIRWQNTGR
ncbi:MAG: uracil-DNA glycosylase [Bacilli bacterium]|jgi:uracil-DNA glycosylase